MEVHLHGNHPLTTYWPVNSLENNIHIRSLGSGSRIVTGVHLCRRAPSCLHYIVLFVVASSSMTSLRIMLATCCTYEILTFYLFLNPRDTALLEQKLEIAQHNSRSNTLMHFQSLFISTFKQLVSLFDFFVFVLHSLLCLAALLPADLSCCLWSYAANTCSFVWTCSRIEWILTCLLEYIADFRESFASAVVGVHDWRYQIFGLLLCSTDHLRCFVLF